MAKLCKLLLVAGCLVCLGLLAETYDIVNRDVVNGHTVARVRILDGTKVVQVTDLDVARTVTEKQLTNYAGTILARYLYDKANPPVVEKPAISAKDVRTLLLTIQTNFNTAVDASSLNAAAKTAVKALWYTTAKEGFLGMIDNLGE